ncbi:MAG: hypothetical protein CL424_10035 [Acidimicrobiaceae bacterium]|nr:hypothetical protein [Acidimicrobiaceae bacterium]
MRRLVTAALATALTLGGVALAAVSDGTATVARTAERVGPIEQPVLLVSDSAWLGIKTYGAKDALRGVDHVMDLASCRRRVTASCRNYDGHVPITLLAELEAHGRHFHTLVVATGYNDSDHTFRSDVDTIVGRARELGYERIVWLTLRANVSYNSPDDFGFDQVFRNNNATLRELVDSGAYPEIVIADWATYAHDRPEWFASDGIHLRTAGPWAAADYVSRKLAHLDGRPCPMPPAPGASTPNPCPDPDAGPPTIDLYGIYPVGEPNPTAGFHMEWEGSGAWPADPWWD